MSNYICKLEEAGTSHEAAGDSHMNKSYIILPWKSSPKNSQQKCIHYVVAFASYIIGNITAMEYV